MASKKSRVLSEEIRPIIEFYPLEPTKRRVKWQILNPKSRRTEYIRTELRSARGLYIFYNSQCRAIYLGKADKRSLWGELNSAFNRKRASQTVWGVHYPKTGTSFTPAYKKKRRIKEHQVYLREIASFVSVYEVGDSLISNLEALMMRAFPNELTNTRMESIRFFTK